MVKTNAQHTHDHQTNLVIPNDKLELTLSWAELKSAYARVVNQASQHLKLKGFRQGKAPAQLAEQQLDPEQIVARVLERVVPPVFLKQIKSNDQLQPIGQPEVRPIKVKKGEAWQVEVHYAQKPQIKLGNYQKIVKQARKKAEAEFKKQQPKPLESNPAVSQPQPSQNDQILQVILKELVSEIKPQVQELLIKAETTHKLQELSHSLKQVNMEIDDYLKRRQMDVKQLVADQEREALVSLQIRFILSEIEQAAQIEVSAEEISAEVNQITNLDLRKHYQKPGPAQDRLKGSLLTKKTVDYLLQIK